jgi:hypothetical protein
MSVILLPSSSRTQNRFPTVEISRLGSTNPKSKNLERATVMITCRTLEIFAPLLAMMSAIAPLPPFSSRAFAQSKGGVSPNDITVVQYVYKGQKYEIRLMRGEVLMVNKDNLPVVMYMRGNARPVGQDASAVAAAEEAVKAYKAGTPSEAGGTPNAAGGGGAASSSGLTVDGVISLLNAGLSDDLIIAKIQKSGQSFDLSTDDMVRLKKAKASDAVIKAMMDAAPAAPGPTPAPAVTSGPAAAAAPAPTPSPGSPGPNAVAENPNMGKLPKESFLGTIGHHTSNVIHGRTVIDQLSMRDILPQWDPNKKLSEQYPHIAITVLYAPQGWTDDYREVLHKKSPLVQNCFKLKAVVWLDATRSKPTDEFQWCIDHDMYMSELQPTYLYSFNPSRADYGQTTGINRTDGPQPPDKLLPNDRATLDMEAKTNPQGAAKDLNLDQLSLFAIMFANVRKDLGQTLGSDGDFRVWVTSIKKAAGPSLF